MATSIFCSNTRLNSCLGRAVEAKKLKTRPAEETGQANTICPRCGGRATSEVVRVTRPGQCAVRRTIIRCWRSGKDFVGRDKCPVTIVSEEPIADHKEETMRKCIQCSADISHRHKNAKWCEDCAAQRKAEQTAKSHRTLAPGWESSPDALGTQIPGTDPTPAEVAPVSLIGLAQRILDRPDRGRTVLAILRALRYAATDPEVSNLIDATMDLPPRRVSLLLHILDDAEQVA